MSAQVKRIAYRRALKGRRDDLSRTDFGPKVLVVISGGGIGNAVEATPLVQGVRALWPKAVMTVVVPHGDLFENWCVPDHITDSQEDVRGASFDHSFFPYPFLSAISPWRQVCDLGVVHHPRVWLRQYFLKPERQYFMDMLKPLGGKGIMPPLYVSLKEPQRHLPEASMRVCIAPGGKNELRWRHKRWLLYGSLAGMIRQTYPHAQICIIGTEEDDFPAEQRDDPHIVDLRGKLTLAETAWILKKASLAVGNDCGPMHIACAVQTPAITIFGPTCAIKNAPWNKGVALITPAECGPCQYDARLETCSDPRCLNEITPQMVMAKMTEILKQTEIVGQV
ncbi:MAG: glycosyltransferase family 9 protein [Phycisphaerae bacterium]|nr:glycosyltransferase family 9 protein [Phycisphaerae bacterium]